MKIFRKIGILILSICIAVPLFSMISYAASGRVSISGASGKVGSTVTVKCTVTSQSGAIGSVDMVLTYDQSALQFVGGSEGTNGGSGRVQYVAATTSTTAQSLSFTAKFKILREGSHTISSGGVEAYTLDEQLMSVSGASAKVTGKSNVAQTDTRDTNNKLNSLQVSVGSMEPSFNADITTYTITVPEETSDVSITATAQSSKAKVVVSGGTNLRLGANTATVTVTAENGAVRTYVLTIMCGEAEKILLGGVEHTINEDFVDEQIPTGFSRKKATYNSRQYEAVMNASGSLVLMNLKSGENTSFYIYNQEAKEFYDFVQIKFAEGKYIIPLPLDKDIAEFAEYETVTLQVQGKNIDAWKLDEEFSVAYAMNQDGKEVLYKYDSVDGTFQRYNDIKVEDVDQAPIEKTWFPNEYYMYAIVGLGALSLILLIAMIYFIASRKARHEGRKKKAIKRQEKQRAKEERQREKEARELEKYRQILEEEREKERQIEEKRMAKQKAKEEKKLAKQKKREE